MQVLMKTYPITEDYYLAAEKAAEAKHEYANGYVYAMVGGSRRHNLLTMTLARLLGNHLQGTDCQVFASDMKVRGCGTRDAMFFYPDVMVVSPWLPCSGVGAPFEPEIRSHGGPWERG